MKKSKIIKFIKLPNFSKLLFVEACFLLAYSRFLILFIPLKKVKRIFGIENNETPFDNDGIDIKKVKQISNAIEIMSKHTFWQSKCLAQAYTAKFMLRKRKYKCTLYFGVTKDDNNMIAHAWTRCGLIYVTGGKGHEKFTITGKFA